MLCLIIEILKWVGIAFLIWLFLVEVVFRIVRHYHHFPIPAFAARFLDTRFRKKLQGTKHIMDALNLRSGMVLLEVGCGPGTFTIDVAKRIGPNGVVHAVDVEPRMIKRLEEKMRRQKVRNIARHVASAYELPLEDSSVDTAFMIAVSAEIPDPVRAFHEIRRVLRPGGILSISEFLLDPDYPRRKTVTRWADKAGFRSTACYGKFYSYTLNFQAKARKTIATKRLR
nr:class I SAM-dependent methyltransferase [Candidatus Njordarchaeum guaymaensis]